MASSSASIARRASAKVRLLVITDLRVADERATEERLTRVLQATERTTVAVGLRDHQASIARRVAFGLMLRELTARYDAALVVHDRIDLALAIGADGVHLGSRSVRALDARALLPDGAWVSRSCHDERELEQAAAESVDVVTLSPIFSSPNKGEPLGVERFAILRRAFPSLRVLALGGVNVHDVESARDAGADGVAVIRAVLGEGDAAEIARRLVEPFS